MDDLHQQISDLIAAEHELRSGDMDDDKRRRLADMEAHLDQLWDLLRQRDARRAAGGEPDAAHVRPVDEVESYLQ